MKHRSCYNKGGGPLARFQYVVEGTPRDGWQGRANARTGGLVILRPHVREPDTEALDQASRARVDSCRR